MLAAADVGIGTRDLRVPRARLFPPSRGALPGGTLAALALNELPVAGSLLERGKAGGGQAFRRRLPDLHPSRSRDARRRAHGDAGGAPDEAAEEEGPVPPSPFAVHATILRSSGTSPPSDLVRRAVRRVPRVAKRLALAAALALSLATAPNAGAVPLACSGAGSVEAAPADARELPIRWRSSRAVGMPFRGRLLRGVQLPSEGDHFFTWDPGLDTSPSRGWRRFGTDRLIRLTLRVLARYAAAHPLAPRVGIGDLSRPHGGDFGPQFGGLGHASHQNGLDIDVYYPRRDRRERPPKVPGQIDRRLAQDLVDAFVAAGAETIFVGPATRLVGPVDVVRALAHHDDHLHVRIARRPPRRGGG